MNRELRCIDDWWDRAGLSRSAPVCAAVSGGRDSMLLLQLLQQLSRRQRIGVLAAAWFDHGLRPEAEIAAEAAVVRRVCQELAIPLHTGRADPQDMAAARSAQGMEAAARRLRYRFLRSTARTVQGNAESVLVATGHHINDQIETTVMRLAGGSGYAGMAGIPATRILEPGVMLIRPLLALQTQQLERLRQEAGVAYHEDSTNRDLAISRNRLRHALLPQLQAQFPHLGASVQRLTADMHAVTNWITRLLPEYLDERRLVGVPGVSADAAGFVQLPGAVRVQYLLSLQNRYAYRSFSGSPTPADESAGERLPRRMFAPLEQLTLRDTRDLRVRRILRAAGIEVYLDSGRLIVAAAASAATYSAERVAPGQPVGDIRSRYPLLVRSAVAGDRLPNGKPLKHWFERAGIPVYLRSGCRVVEDPLIGVAGIIDTSGQIIRFVQE